MNTNSPQPEIDTEPIQVSPTPTEPVATSPVQQTEQPVRQGVSEDTKTLITVLLLIFVYPIGLIVMFFWPKWKWWVKLLVALPLLFLPLLLAAMLIAVNPSAQIEKAECVTACEESGGTNCVEMCSEPESTSVDDSTELMEPAVEQ